MACVANSTNHTDAFKQLYDHQCAQSEKNRNNQTAASADVRRKLVFPTGFQSKETTSLSREEWLEDLSSSNIPEEDFVGKALAATSLIEVLNNKDLDFPLDESGYMRMLHDENIDKTDPAFDSECRRQFEIMIRNLLADTKLSPKRVSDILNAGSSQEDVQFVVTAATLLICLCSANNNGDAFVAKLFKVNPENILKISPRELCDARKYAQMHTFAQPQVWQLFPSTVRV